MKKITIMALSLIIIVSALTGCSVKNNINLEKTVISVSMYNDVSFPQWRTYVENQCPDVHIEWRNNRNDIGKLLYRAQHDDMADIVAIRRFEEDTAKLLQPHLLDVSDLKEAKEINESYAPIFQRDGKNFWLPQSGAMDALIINEDLFSRYNISIPTDMDSFIFACKEFEKMGIRGFMVDIAENWGSDRLIQCMGLAPFLMTNEGLLWSENALQKGEYTENIKGFSEIGNLLTIFRDENIIQKDDLEKATTSYVSKMMFDQKLAMSILCSDVGFDRTNTLNLKAIPHFSTENGNGYILSYPVFSIALSKKLEEDLEKLENAKKVLNAMMSAKAQKLLSEQGEGLVPYNDVKLEYSDTVKDLIPYMNEEDNYIRVLMKNTFNSSKIALEEILIHNGTGEDFANTYFSHTNDKDEETYIGTNELDIDNALITNAFNSPFASVVAQTIQIELDADIALIDSNCASAPLFKGDYTDKQIKSIVDSCNLFEGDFLGSEIKEMIRQSVYSSYRFEPGNIEPLLNFPAISGVTIYHSATNPVTECKITETEVLSDNKTYKLVIDQSVLHALETANYSSIDKFLSCGVNAQDVFIRNWKSTGSLPAPKVYFVKMGEFENE